MTPDPTDHEGDPQDQAETFDETTVSGDAAENRSFEAMDDQYDATSAEDDDDTEGYEDEEIDPDEVDESLEAARDDEGLRSGERGGVEVANDDVAPVDLESKSDPAENISEDRDPHVDKQLDKGLKETFPASDPVSINPGAD